jgi:uncharacterized protein YbcV (DUF1398 family)
MFTLDQIRNAHSKVKSGADFPAYIRDMKALGVAAYEHYVADGHIRYYGQNGAAISAPPKWAPRTVTTQADAAQLKHYISAHQQGQTDYPAFCRQAAEAGVEKWVIDMPGMTCTYYDKAGNAMLVEPIPQV